MALVYIDTVGNYGEGDDLVVFDLDKVSDEDVLELRRTLDQGVSPFAWVMGMGEKLKREHIIVEGSVALTTEKAVKLTEDILKKRFGL